ncbi:MAG: BrnA antitoxin family protein [Spirochaetaceae bacterium]|nr:BrnA antitoxin family protein [Spirochaetaceae bacterium]
MSGAKTLSSERIAEIKAFKNTNFIDCPVMTEEELKKLRPRHPEYFKPKKQAVQIRIDADVLAWFKSYGKGYQSKINAILRDVMLHNTNT